MRTLLLGAVLLACGLGAAEAPAAPPEIDTAIRSERMVLRLKPGEVVKVKSTAHFQADDTVGIAAWANGKQLWDVNSGGHRLELAGRGAYVVFYLPENRPAEVKAVALRKMRLTIVMEWTA